MVTLVTGYWTLNESKHGVQNYETWIKQALQVYAPLVAFVGCEADRDAVLDARPQGTQTLIVLKPLSEFTMLDPSQPIHETHPRHCPHPDLGRIWLEKLALVAEAAHLNPFGTEWFAWYDAAMCTYRETPPPLHPFPDTSSLSTLSKECLNYTASPETIGASFEPVTRGTYMHGVTGTWIAHAHIVDGLVALFRNYVEIVCEESKAADAFMYLSDQVVWTRMMLDHPSKFHQIGVGYGTFLDILGFDETRSVERWVSMVVPVYNTCTDFMKEAFDSIRTQSIFQTGCHLELVVLNDGSSEECTGALKQILDTVKSDHIHVRYMENDQNLGLGTTLRRGVDACTGDLIFRMDSDDVMVPSRLEKQLAYMDRTPSAPACGTQIQAFTDKNGVREFLSVSKLHPVLKLTQYRNSPVHWFVAHPSMCYRRSTLNKVGNYDPTHARMVEDFDLHLRILKEFGRIDNVDESLLQYRSHPDQVTRTSGQPAPNKTWHDIQDELIAKWILR